MARSPNQIGTVQITLSTTELIKEFLEVLVNHGTYGKNVAEAAERLVSEKIVELRDSGGAVGESLNRRWLLAAGKETTRSGQSGA